MSETQSPSKLVERIDQVRRTRDDLAKQLTRIAGEIPGSATRSTLRQLAARIETPVASEEIVARFPQHCWLLTLQSSAATADAFAAVLEQTAYHHRLSINRMRAIAYPLLLLMVSTAMILALLLFIVPTFDEMYQEFGIELPSITMILITCSRIVAGAPLVVAGSLMLTIGSFGALLWIWVRGSWSRQRFFGGSIDVPSLRQAVGKAAFQIAELLDEGLSLEKSLWIAAESNPRSVVGNLLTDLAVQASDDAGKLNSTRAAAVLPRNFIYALLPQTSESRTTVRAPSTMLLRQLAASYQDLSLRERDWFTAIIAPVTVVVLGLIIGLLIAALFLPFLSLITALS